MAVGAAIAGAVVGVAQLGIGAYGVYSEYEHNKEMEDLQKKSNRLAYKDNMNQLDNAEADLIRNYENTQDSMTLDLEQTQDTADRQFDDAVATETTALRKAGNELTDFRVESKKKEGTSNSVAAQSGVKKSGTVAKNLDLEEQKNDELESRAEQNIEDEVAGFSRKTEDHWAQLDDYQERHDMQMDQLEENHKAKLAQLSESKDMLTARYRAGVNINSANYAYATDGAWLQYGSQALSSFNTALSTYQSLDNIFG